MYGGAAADLFAGDAFDNQLFGNGGNDQLRGFGGADKLTGGAGADLYHYNALFESTVATTVRDSILDFSHADGDKIVLNLIDANTGVAGDQAFTLGALTAGQAGRLSVTANGAGAWLVQGDVDGNGTADFAIAVTASVAPVAADFVL